MRYSVLVLILASCGGAIVPTNASDPEFGFYGTLETGVSGGTVSGPLAGSTAPHQSVSLTSGAIEGAANALVAIGPVGLRPKLFGGFDFDSHQARYIGLGIDALVTVFPHFALLVGADSISDNLDGTTVSLASLNGHRFSGGAAYMLGRIGLFARYVRTSVSRGDGDEKVDAPGNGVLVGATIKLR